MDIKTFVIFVFPSGAYRRLDVQNVHARVERGVVKFLYCEGALICVWRGLCLALAMHKLGDVRAAGLAAKLRLVAPPCKSFDSSATVPRS